MLSPARAFLSRHRLSLSLLGVVGFFGVVLPACGGPSASDFTPTTELIVQPTPVPVLHGGQSVGLSGVMQDFEGGPVTGSITYSRDAQYASVLDVNATSGLVTAQTVQSAVEVIVPITVSGNVTQANFNNPPTVTKQITVRTRVAGINITGAGALSLGADVQLTATPSIVAGSPTTPSPIMTWSSSNPTAVAVGNTGRVTVLQPVSGGVMITASSEGRTGVAEVAVTNAGDPLTITTATLPNATIAGTYSSTLASTGGPVGGTLSWELASGALPTGITLGANGVLTSSNVSATAGTYNFVVRVSSRLGVATVTTTKALSITVSAAPLIVTVTPAHQFTTLGVDVTYTLSQTDAAGNPVGTPPAVTWSLSSPTTALIVSPGRFRGESTGGTVVRATAGDGAVYTAALTVGARGAAQFSVSLGALTGPAADGAQLEALFVGGGTAGLGVVGAGRVGVVPGLAAGTYSVRITRAGYVTQTIPNVVVTSGVVTNMGAVFLVPQ